MGFVYEKEGTPDVSLLQEFFDGTLETPSEKEKKAERMQRDQRAENRKEQIAMRTKGKVRKG